MRPEVTVDADGREIFVVDVHRELSDEDVAKIVHLLIASVNARQEQSR